MTYLGGYEVTQVEAVLHLAVVEGEALRQNDEQQPDAAGAQVVEHHPAQEEEEGCDAGTKLTCTQHVIMDFTAELEIYSYTESVIEIWVVRVAKLFCYIAFTFRSDVL